MPRLPANRLSDMGHIWVVADKLFRLGARPPVVRSLCPIGKKTAIRLYQSIHQQSPKQGLLPYDPYWIVRSSVTNIHASIFLGLFQDFTRQQKSAGCPAETFIAAYELYGRVVAHNPNPSKLEAGVAQAILLDINRAWQLSGQLRAGEMGLVICGKCLARHAVLNKMPKPFQQCPICEVWADKSGRRRWVTVNARKNT